MVEALDKEEHKALLEAFWAKIIPNFVSQGFSDEDIESASLEASLDGTRIQGWEAVIELKNGSKLVYTQEASEGSPILCNGQAINTEQEV